jgi:hypothetical protein
MLLRPEKIAENENDARHPSKAARTILTAPNQVKIASQLSNRLISQRYLASFQLAESRDDCTAIDHRDIANKSALDLACIAFLGLLGWPAIPRKLVPEKRHATSD